MSGPDPDWRGKNVTFRTVDTKESALSQEVNFLYTAEIIWRLRVKSFAKSLLSQVIMIMHKFRQCQ